MSRIGRAAHPTTENRDRNLQLGSTELHRGVDDGLGQVFSSRLIG